MISDPDNIINGSQFWENLLSGIRLDKPLFKLDNIDYKLTGFTGEEKFPISFWNSATIQI